MITEDETEFSLSPFQPQTQRMDANHKTPLCVGWLRSVEWALLVKQAAKLLQSQCPSAQQYFSWPVWQLHTHCCISKAKIVKFDLYWNVESIFSLKLVSIKNTVELWCAAPPAFLSNTGLHLQNKWLSKGWSPSSRVFLAVYCVGLLPRIC